MLRQAGCWDREGGNRVIRSFLEFTPYPKCLEYDDGDAANLRRSPPLKFQELHLQAEGAA